MAETLPLEKTEAELAATSRKGVLHGSKDAEVDGKLTEALKTLVVRVHRAQKVGPTFDPDVVEVLENVHKMRRASVPTPPPFRVESTCGQQ